MDEPFVNRITKLKQDVLELKTCPVKTCTQLATMTESINVTFTLVVHPGGGFPSYAYSSKKAYITVTANENMITMCTIKNNAGAVTNYNLNGRSITIYPYQCGSTAIYTAVLYSENENDIQDILDGKTVTLNYTLDVTATSNITLTVSYEDYDDGQ